MTYIDPHISDQQLIDKDSRLSRRQSRRDFLAAKAERGFDAARLAKERHELLPGFRKIPGASRSGALEPRTRSKFERMEREGSIEVQRWHGQMVGFRPVGDEEEHA